MERFKQLVHECPTPTLTKLYPVVVSVVDRLKAEKPGAKIYLVSGRVSSDDPEQFERNEQRLRDIAGALWAENPQNIYISSAHIMPAIRETIRKTENPPYKRFVDFWEAFVQYANIDGLVMTPGWQDSSGATKERDTAIIRGLEVIDYTGWDPAQRMAIAQPARRAHYLG